MTQPHRARARPGWTLGLGAAALLAGLAGCSNSDDAEAPPQIRTLSNRADLVSGGDVLVEVSMPAVTGLNDLRVQVDGRDVTAAFRASGDGRATGLITGLAVGNNTVAASAFGTATAKLVVTNAPRHGPVMSGPLTVPFYCARPTPQPVSGTVPALNASGLSGAPDAQRNIATEFKLYYRSSTAGCSLGLPDPTPAIGANATTVPANPNPPANPCFKPYTVGSTPGDMATATTDAGVTVPYIVRLERGTMSRGIYDLAVLFDPTRTWSAVVPQATWNRKLLITFGASTGQPRRQARPATAWTSTDAQLARGYMTLVHSMLDSARNSNRVLMSETTMMMKEHITDNYGPIRFTIGTGCSGGSINSNMNASVAPGLLDGITTTCTYPDSESTGIEVGDCVALVEAYQKPEWLALMTGQTQDQIGARKAAINGHIDQSACHAWYNAFGTNGRAGLFFPRLVTNNVSGAITQQANASNNCEMPNSAVYDPANAAATANLPRCNAWNWAESIWGKVPGSPAARDTRDNVGVQYGLKALRDGAINGEEFVTLNTIIGGIDRDSTPRAARSTADTAALEIAYRAGIVASGRQLAKTAIIDMRGWDDSNITVPPGATPGTIPIHHQWFSFGIRDRITTDAGNAGNQALWRFARTGLTPPGTMGTDAFLLMDQWLTALKADTSGATLEQKVRSARPAATADFCLLPTDSTQTVKVTTAALCDADPFLKPSLSPRQVSGGPRAENILKCQLKPLLRADYAAGTFTDAQWARLQAVFPDGVCDWSKPGVGQQAAISPLTFSAGPGGQPLAAEPVSTRQ
ncbi:MAG: hypothetical protein H7Z19_21425 [Chitinophagaceae bacterium]|nr:hypothetical protein [Rubrivivax sp.]